jgi:hypothetical protein
MVDRAVRIDWVLLAASGMATGPDAELSGARDAGRHGVAHCVLPILSLVVLSRVAGVHWSARRLLSNGGEARHMIEKNLSASIALFRHQAKLLDKTITRFNSLKAVQSDEYRSRRRLPGQERIRAVMDLNLDLYALKGQSADAPRLQRTVVRLQHRTS